MITQTAIAFRGPISRLMRSIGFGLAALMTVITLAHCAPAPAGTLPAEISVADALAKRASGAFMLDVRQPDEWAEYHMPNSTLIPLEKLDARLSELPRDREIVVVCRSGNRSAAGRDILKQAGFQQVTSMAGGLAQWRAAGYPTVSGQ